MIKLALASLRFRAAASLAMFLAVLLGGAILIACGGLFETAIRLDALPQRLAGAPLVIAGQPGFPLPDEESETVAYVERPGLPVALVERLSTVDEMARAIPDASFPAVGPAESGTTLAGHDWAAATLTPYTLSAGTEPRTSGEVVLDAGSAPEMPPAARASRLNGPLRTDTRATSSSTPTPTPTVATPSTAPCSRWPLWTNWSNGRDPGLNAVQGRIVGVAAQDGSHLPAQLG